MRYALTLSVALATAACGAGANRSPADTGGLIEDPSHAEASPDRAVATGDADPSGEDSAPALDATAREALAAARRRDAPRPGDFHVYRYSGTFTKRPVTLTEQVLSVADDGATVTDFVMEDGDQSTLALRVEKDPTGEVVAVTRRSPTGEEPGSRADFDRMMKRIQFVPDRNDELVGSEKTTCMVGADAVDCEVTKYKVTVGTRSAVLSVARATDVTGRDLGGEIVTASGKVIYAAALLERGNEAPSAKTVALLARVGEHRLSPSR